MKRMSTDGARKKSHTGMDSAVDWHGAAPMKSGSFPKGV